MFINHKINYIKTLDISTVMIIISAERILNMDKFAWPAYLATMILWYFGLYKIAILVFLVGMVCHWKYWIPAIIAFFIGLNWKSKF